MRVKTSSNKRRMDSSKTIYHMDRVIDFFEEGKRIPPVHIDMGISKFCNINCVFCYGIYQNMSKEMIERGTLLQTMRDAGEIGVRSIAVIGDGEPTMNPNFYDALKVGKESGLSLATSTNGVLLDTDSKLETILENCEWMRFTLAAGDREGYKRNHRKDYWDEVSKNVRRIVELRDQEGYECDIGLQAVFVPNMMEEDMIKEARFAVDSGVDYFVIKQCSLPEDNRKVANVEFDPEDYGKEEVKEYLRRAEDMSTERTKIIPKWNVMGQFGERDYQGCPSIPLVSEMSGNGDWYPCGYMFGEKEEFDEYKFGNVHEKSLKEIWESDRYWDIVEKMKQFNVQNDCTGCCRQDQVNRFLSDYLDKPKGINFI